MIDLTQFGKPIETKTVKAENFGDLNYVFADSKFLPVDLDFEGCIERESANGTAIPYYAFSKDATKIFLLSQWNKNVVIPLELQVKDKARIYLNNKNQLEVLKLN